MPFAPTRIVSINTFSDGDSNQRPKGPGVSKVDPPQIYLEKIASLWMSHRGESVPGVRYVLDRLPDGYALWIKRRSKHEAVTDKYLYGHPSGRYFDSPNRFFPHCLHLMDHGTNEGCPCTVCHTAGGKIPAIKTHQPPSLPILGLKSKGRPRIHEPPQPLDSEGTPDIYRTLINRLQRVGKLDVPIEEPMSLDWRVENEYLQGVLDKTSKQPSWIPRLGELVLLIRNVDEVGSVRRTQTGEFKIFDRKKNQWQGFPSWEAGVVTQVAEEALQIEELTRPSIKDFQVNYTGFRVEPISNPNSKSKPFSRQYKYLPLHHIKPFAFAAELLRGVPQDYLRETIENANSLSCTLTLIGKLRFKGTWPSSEIYCKGIYLGAELLVVGDAVRLVPTPRTAQVTEILRITAIKLCMWNLDKATQDDQSDGHPYNSTVAVVGKAYTTDVKRAAAGAQPIRISFGLIPAELQDYGKWYPMHASDQSFQVPFTRILGRCYGSEAVSLWFSQPFKSGAADAITPSAALSLGCQGILEARDFARKHDKRLSKGGSKWLWSDTRAEALDVESFNGIETAKYDESRDPKRWVRHIKEFDGIAGPEDKAALIRAAEKKRASFGGLASQSSFVQSALTPISGTASDEDEEDIQRARKRSRSVAEERQDQNSKRLSESEDPIQRNEFLVSKAKEPIVIDDDEADDGTDEELGDRSDSEDVQMVLSNFQSRK
ncbi:MAG: hypothetical protein M1821_004713 [Bathelium mastoideum]|nr:MAG: hypothetical protein M1821_004713 [Bathelium mastoideum]KAI9692123.1 MAG: hypothetical protein M1822_006353 [Bathelium mastoideum]